MSEQDIRRKIQSYEIGIEQEELRLDMFNANSDEERAEISAEIAELEQERQNLLKSIQESNSSLNESSKYIKFRDHGITNLMDLKNFMDYLNSEGIDWEQVGQSFKFNSPEDRNVALRWLTECDCNDMSNESDCEDKDILTDDELMENINEIMDLIIVDGPLHVKNEIFKNELHTKNFKKMNHSELLQLRGKLQDMWNEMRR